MKVKSSESPLWEQLSRRLNIRSTDVSRRPESKNSSSPVTKHIFHLTIKKSHVFAHKTYYFNNKLCMQFHIAHWSQCSQIEYILHDCKITDKLTLYSIPLKTIPILFHFLFYTKDLSSLKYLKIDHILLNSDYLSVILKICKNLEGLSLPESHLQPTDVLDIIKALPKLTNLDTITTTGVIIPSNFFAYLMQNRRIFHKLLIWPQNPIDFDHLYSYIPLWETFIINSSPTRYTYGPAAISLRVDTIFSPPCIDKTFIDEKLQFIADLTNMVYSEQQKLCYQYEADSENAMPKPKTSTKAKYVYGKCIFFELPTEDEFMKAK